MLNLSVPWFWTSSLQNYEKKKVLFISHSVRAVCYSRPNGLRQFLSSCPQSSHLIHHFCCLVIQRTFLLVSQLVLFAFPSESVRNHPLPTISTATTLGDPGKLSFHSWITKIDSSWSPHLHLLPQSVPSTAARVAQSDPSFLSGPSPMTPGGPPSDRWEWLSSGRKHWWDIQCVCFIERRFEQLRESLGNKRDKYIEKWPRENEVMMKYWINKMHSKDKIIMF